MSAYGFVNIDQDEIQLVIYCHKCEKLIKTNVPNWQDEHKDCADEDGRIGVALEHDIEQ
jgi:hypothetical protein